MSHLVALVFLLLLAPAPGEAQPPAATARIGYLSPLSAAVDSPNLEAFRRGLDALGYVEGQNAAIEARYANGDFERLPGLAADLARLRVDVIVAAPTPGVRAAQQATRTIPIVMAFTGDPIGEGFVASLARPGGNVTGQSATVTEITTKRVEFLKTLVPRLSRVTHLVSPATTRRTVTETERAGLSLGVRITTITVDDAPQLDRALSAMQKARTGGLIVSLTLREHWKRIVDFALEQRLPTVSGPREFVESGGLMAYGPHYPDLFRRAATYVDKILRGAKPADLPVEQPTKFEFAINRRTAKALGLNLPSSLLLQVDHVVE